MTHISRTSNYSVVSYKAAALVLYCLSRTFMN